MKVGDKVMVDDGRTAREYAITAIGRKYVTLDWNQRERFDLATGSKCGVVYGHGVRFYTLEQWAKIQRVGDAQRLLSDASGRAILVSKLRDFAIGDDEVPPLDEFTQLMSRAIELLDACKEAKR